MHIHIGLVAGVNLVADNRYLGGLHHTLDEEGAGDDETNLDGDGEVEDDGQEEGDQQDGNITLGILEQALEGAPAAHVVADNHQYGCQGCHGDILGKGHQYQQDEQQHNGMYDTGHGGATAIVDVGHGTCDGSCGRDTAEDGGYQIGHALRHKLHVGIMLVGDDAVGNGSGEQTLDSAQDGNGEGYGHKGLYQLEGDGGNYHLRQLGLDVEAVADGVYARDAELVLQDQHGGGSEEDAVERAGNLVQDGHTLQGHG